MAKAGGGEGEIAQAIFNLASVMIFILIFLILSARELFQGTSVKVELPKAHVIEADLEQSISISVTKDHKYYVGDEEVPLEKIAEIVKQKHWEYVARNENDSTLYGEQLVVIRADKGVDWGSVLAAVDQAKKAKSKRITLAVVKKD